MVSSTAEENAADIITSLAPVANRRHQLLIVLSPLETLEGVEASSRRCLSRRDRNVEQKVKQYLEWKKRSPSAAGQHAWMEHRRRRARV